MILVGIALFSHVNAQSIDSIIVGVAFVEFSDADTTVDSRGGVGFSADTNGVRHIDTLKYTYQFWFDFFFKEEGHVSHPDSATHLDVWPAAFTPFYYGSMKRWCTENSYGRHVVVPFVSGDRPYNGILNSIDSLDRIEWIRLPGSKLDYHNIFSVGNPLVVHTESALENLKDSYGSPYHDSCDVVIIVYAGKGFGTYFSFEGKGDAVMPEKTPSSDGTDENAILTFHMNAATHEYTHAMSADLLDATVHPELFLNDYGYDEAGIDMVGSSRWVGLSGMYMHGTAFNRPYHLDPWAKLMLGWIDYEILSVGDHYDVELPIIAENDEIDVPHVLVIPIDVPWSVESPAWYEGHYLIIENRRRYPGSFDETVIDTDSDGGFLVWEYSSELIEDQRGGLTLVEADGDYDMKFIGKADLQALGLSFSLREPTSSDFWDTTAVLSTWTRHMLGMLDPVTMKSDTVTPDVVSELSRQITIQFGEYSASGTVNVIPYIGISSPTSNTKIATKNNNQTKFIKDKNKLAFVATANLEGEMEQSEILAFESKDNGISWSRMAIMNNREIWRDTTGGVYNHWEPRIDSSAASPAIVQMQDTWGVVWQVRVDSATYRLRFGRKGELSKDLTGSNIQRTNGELTPVIAYGRIDSSATTDTLMKVVYCTDQGLQALVSSDAGNTWITDSSLYVILDSLTTASSLHPSLAMSEEHEVLVYEENETIFAIIDGRPPVNISRYHPELQRNMQPMATMVGSKIHLAWIAEIEELVPEYSMTIPHRHIKPFHKVFDVDSVEYAIVGSLINLKYGRVETAQRPVFAVKNPRSSYFEGSIVWSVTDSLQEGARLRYNEFSINTTTGQHEWGRKSSYESGFSNVSTFHPLIAASDGDVKYIVTRGNEEPYRLQMGSIPALPADDKHIGNKDVAINVLDAGSNTWQNRVVFKQPVMMDQQGQILEIMDISGIPFAGFDGSHDGPTMDVLTMTPVTLMSEDDTITWKVQVHRMETNNTTDTNLFRVNMYDATTQQIIASSTDFIIPPTKSDSTFTASMTLPPSHFPAADIMVSAHVEGDAYDTAPRFYTALHNIFTDEPTDKAVCNNRREMTGWPNQPEVYIYPQPATEAVRISMRSIPNEQVRITLLDCLGRCVLEEQHASTADGVLRMQLDVRDLTSGVYICRIAGGTYGINRIVRIIR